MVEISLKRRADPAEWRCPWCHEGETGDSWQVCQNDETPIHAACLTEYKLCPICREAVSCPSTTAKEAARSLEIQVRRRSSSPGESPPPIVVPSLPAEIQTLLSTIRRDYYDASFWPLNIALGLLWVALFLSCRFHLILTFPAMYLALYLRERLRDGHSKPRREAWSAPKTGDSGNSFALELVEGDRAALLNERLWQEQQSALSRLDRQQRELWLAAQSANSIQHQRLLARARDELRARTPIEDAQIIHGIGPAIIARLRGANLHSMADLRNHGQQAIAGIEPAQRAMLAEWVILREEAIERLAETQVERPPLTMNHCQENELRSIRQFAVAHAFEMTHIEAELSQWQRARESLLAQLESQWRAQE